MITTRIAGLLLPVLQRLALGLLGVGVVAALVSQPGPTRKELTAEFDRAGLSVRAGDEVRLRGVPIGRISAIEVDRETFTANYVLSVDEDAPIHAGAQDALRREVRRARAGDPR